MPAAGPSGERVLAFSAAGQALALAAADVAEVVVSPGITRVPQAPPALRGLANIRGRVTPILSLDVLMGAEQAADAGQVIVLDRESPVGLAVERVSAIRAAGAGEARVRLLDLEPLLAKALARARPAAKSERLASVGESAAAERSDELAFLQFRLADQIYALPLDQVREVRPAPAEVTAMPHAEAVMIGLAPLGGRLVARCGRCWGCRPRSVRPPDALSSPRWAKRWSAFWWTR
jgi:purine-binding chemotaxis protein CheW